MDAVMAASIEPLTETIADMNREQLWSGKASDGSRLAPPYAASTVKAKTRKRQPTDRVTLKDTGAFHDSIKARPERKYLSVQSQHNVKGYDLAEHLNKRYGGRGSIYGLTQENRVKLITNVKPLFAKNMKDEIG